MNHTGNEGRITAKTKKSACSFNAAATSALRCGSMTISATVKTNPAQLRKKALRALRLNSGLFKQECAISSRCLSGSPSRAAILNVKNFTFQKLTLHKGSFSLKADDSKANLLPEAGRAARIKWQS